MYADNQKSAAMQRYSATANQGIAAAPMPVLQETVTVLHNQLADEIVTLRALITNLYSELNAVCMPPQIPPQGTETSAPMHSLSALAQLQTLIDQVRGASQDVRDMISGLRV